MQSSITFPRQGNKANGKASSATKQGDRALHEVLSPSETVLVPHAISCAEKKESQIPFFDDSGLESIDRGAIPQNLDPMLGNCALPKSIPEEDRLGALDIPPKVSDLYISYGSANCPSLAHTDQHPLGPASLKAPLDADGLSAAPFPGWQLNPDGAEVSLPENQPTLPPQMSFADPHTSPIDVDDSDVDDLELTPSSIKRISKKLIAGIPCADGILFDANLLHWCCRSAAPDGFCPWCSWPVHISCFWIGLSLLLALDVDNSSATLWDKADAALPVFGCRLYQLLSGLVLLGEVFLCLDGDQLIWSSDMVAIPPAFGMLLQQLKCGICPCWACSWTRSFGLAEDAAGILFADFSAAGYEVNELLPLLMQWLRK
ncbi:hypothetical protein Nepgr_023137 [Nepenthes gracilis]|uniref:Uncharacterized protein n=1 Tax=Nepenthes gracilis TaxID=150966 RepID=A0AAD3T1X5_NEPGR|nr:hypothetical protein Nepgr_023137 [Nepenthes gracilis]